MFYQLGHHNYPAFFFEIRTNNAVGVTAPALVVVDPYTLEIYWHQPSTPNGPIIGYHLYRSVGGQSWALWYSGPGTTLSTVDNGTQPLGQYAFLLEASTPAGSTNSSSSEVCLLRWLYILSSFLQVFLLLFICCSAFHLVINCNFSVALDILSYCHLCSSFTNIS